MTWDWKKWLGVVAAGFAGATVFNLATRILGDTSLVINSDVVGAAIGASLTIIGTLVIDAGRRKSEERRKVHQLRRSIVALKGVAEAANGEVDMAKPIRDRANDTAVFLAALGGGREMLDYARSRIDIEDVGLWLKLETLNRAFDRFDKQREADKVALNQLDVTEECWTIARERMVTFNNDVIERLGHLIVMIDR